jgi:Tfp pilus assembly protein PilN
MKTYVNLLPVTYRRKQLLRLRVWQWSMAGLLVLLVMGGAAWRQWSAHQSGAERLATLKREYEPVRILDQESQQLEQRIRELRHREKLVLSLADQQPLLSLIGMLSEAVRTCEGQVSIRTLNLQSHREQEDAGDMILTLNGIATDDAAVAKFADAIRAFQAFHQVELKSTGSTEIATQGHRVAARTYRLECLF